MNVINEAAFEQHQTLAGEIERGLDTSSLTDLGYSDASVGLADKLGVVKGAGSMPVTETGQQVMTFKPEEDWYIPPVSIEDRAIGLRGVLRVFAKQNSNRGLLKAVRKAEHAPELEGRIGSSELHSGLLPNVRYGLNPKHNEAKEDFIKAGGYDPNSDALYEDWDDFNGLYLRSINAENRVAYEKTLDKIAKRWSIMRSQSETPSSE